MPLLTGAEILAHAGTPRATADQVEWADVCATAITAAIAHYLGLYPTDPPDIPDVPPDTEGYLELVPAARSAGLELYKRREAPFGATDYADVYGQAIRLSRDYLAAILPTLRRWHPTAGIHAA